MMGMLLCLDRAEPLRRVKDIAARYAQDMDDHLVKRAEELFREHPFLEAPDRLEHLAQVEAQDRVRGRIPSWRRVAGAGRFASWPLVSRRNRWTRSPARRDRRF